MSQRYLSVCLLTVCVYMFSRRLGEMPVKAARVGIELINIEIEGDTTGNMCIVKF